MAIHGIDTLTPGTKIKTALVAALALGGVALAAGSAAAAPSHTVALGTGTHVAAKTSGTEYFRLVASADDQQSVVLHGLVTAFGTSHPYDGRDVAQLGGGKLTVFHPDKGEKFSAKVNQKTCFAVFTFSGSYTLGKGTGAFKTFTGSGTYVGHGEGILRRNKAGACSENAEPAGEVLVIDGHGPATLG